MIVAEKSVAPDRVASRPYPSQSVCPTLSDRYQTVAAVLAAARREAGLSQRSLAIHLGKSHSHISLIETGRRRVEALELYRMAKAFGLQPAALFDSIAKRLESIEPEMTR